MWASQLFHCWSWERGEIATKYELVSTSKGIEIRMRKTKCLAYRQVKQCRRGTYTCISEEFDELPDE